MTKEIKIKTPAENILATLKGKKVLFLENDNSLDNGLDVFQEILQAGNIEHKVLFGLSKMNIEDIIAHITEYDAIVFQTRWQTDASLSLSEYMFALETKKIVVEVFLGDPTWYYKPKSAHDVYIYNHILNWFYKLSDKPYWDYKNEFDK